jgi:PAS domain-containing protein
MATESSKAAWRGGRELIPDLAELCRIHEVGLDLIERSHDVDELLTRVLEEYEKRLRELPGDALDGRAGKPSPESVRKLRALVMFATQAAALREKAVAASELKRRAEEAESHRARLDGVLGALGSGVMILGPGGEMLKANAAARALIGGEDEAVLARLIADGVPSGGEAEIDLPDGTARNGRSSSAAARSPRISGARWRSSRTSPSALATSRSACAWRSSRRSCAPCRS